MREANCFLIFLEPLKKSNIEYMATGSAASIIYGEPRLTNDIDLVVVLNPENILQLVSVFDSKEFYCPSVEKIREESEREKGGHFNIIHRESGFKADIYPAGEDKLHIWAMSRRKKIRLEKIDIWLAPPEYVIIRKLEYFKEGRSEKHLSDIRRMLEISGDIINIKELKLMISEYHLEEQWIKVKGI